MPSIQSQVSIPANGINANVLSGSIWEFPDRNYYVRLAATGDAAFGLRLTVQAGQRTQLEESAFSGQNRFPVIPDDVIIARFAAPARQRLILKVRNTTGAAINFFYNLELTAA